MQQLKGEDNSKLEPKEIYSINILVKKVVLRGFKHAESKSSLYYDLPLLLKEVSAILCWQFFLVFKTYVFGQN